MNTTTARLAGSAAFAALLLGAAIAGCGGGGGGYGGAVNMPHNNPSPSPSPGILGNMNVTTAGTYPTFTQSAAASDLLVFSCGCTSVAGTGATDASGNFNIISPATPIPTPNPSYTIVPSRNYVVIAEPGSLAGPQAWTIVFAGSVPAHDLTLNSAASPMPGVMGSSDVYTTAAALYIFKNSTFGGNQAIDDWNFNMIEAWVLHLAANPNAAERTLFADIAAQGGAGASLFTRAPGWNMSQPTAAPVINADLNTVKNSADAAIPTPCPSGPGSCTGTPTP